MVEYDGHSVSKEEVESRLEASKNKTLGEIDRHGMFDRVSNMKKVTGVAGTIVEESIMGYPADNKQRPDLLLDGIPTELKTTGVRRSKTDKRVLEAKEPMSITAVSLNSIVDEDFDNSNFWHKLAHLLFVYYLYDSESTVQVQDYANFPIVGYDFFEFDEEQKEILRKDWSLVREFIRNLQEQYDDPRTEYPRLSSELRDKLMFIDTAPKYPHSPRFRLKRSVVNSIVSEYFNRQTEKLETPVTSYELFDRRLHEYAEKYKGMTVRELLDELGINWNSRGDKEDVSKSISATIIAKMFGATATKVSNIKLFSELGIKVKSLTVTRTGKRTEDFKMSGLEVPSWVKEKNIFEESLIYSYFSESTFLFTIFKEPCPNSKLLDNVFVGFKRFVFPQEFIDGPVQKLWVDTRDKIRNHTLSIHTCYDKNGKPKINKKTKTIKERTNFLKSSENEAFLRGTGTDATKKTTVINGLRMYTQDVWVSGKTLVKMLEAVSYL